MGSEPTGQIARKVASLKFDGLFVRSLKASGTSGRSPSYWEDTKGEPCVYCMGPGLTKEHLQTRLRGGTDGWENCVRACGQCNNRRQQLPPLWFYAMRQGRLGEKDLLRIAKHVNTLGTFPLRPSDAKVLAPVRRDHRV